MNDNLDNDIQKSSSTTKRVAVDSLTITATQLLYVLIFILSTVTGIGWYLYTEGVFSPNEEARKNASEAKYAYEKASDDLERALSEIKTLQGEISIKNNKISQLKHEKEINTAQLEYRTNQNSRVAQLIIACINATTSGETSASVTKSEGPHYSSGGGAAAAAAITAISKPQNGASVMNECAKIYKEKVGPLLN